MVIVKKLLMIIYIFFLIVTGGIMQSKLSKLQKEILIFVHKNKAKIRDYNPIVSIYDRRKNERRGIEEVRPYLEVVYYHRLSYNFAKRFDKLIDGKYGKIIKPSFSVSLSNSISALYKRELINLYYQSFNETFLELTNEGIETAKQLEQTSFDSSC